MVSVAEPTVIGPFKFGLGEFLNAPMKATYLFRAKMTVVGTFLGDQTIFLPIIK